MMPKSVGVFQIVKRRRPFAYTKKPQSQYGSAVSLFGDPAGIRTPDPLLKRQLLCQLSYRIR